MGVHKISAYPEVKRLLDIPEDEPIFILRAQDNAAMETIPDYAVNAKRKGAETNLVRDVADVSMAFASWRQNNRDKCKTPDMPPKEEEKQVLQ